MFIGWPWLNVSLFRLFHYVESIANFAGLLSMVFEES